MTPDIQDLCARLGWHSEHPVTGNLVLTNPDGPAAAALILLLSAERDAARQRVIVLEREACQQAMRLLNKQRVIDRHVAAHVTAAASEQRTTQDAPQANP